MLIPNPGYPTYTSAVKLAGGTPLYYELTAENSWAPDFENLEKSDLSKVKLMWVNYPHMPTGQSPTKALFEQLVAFGKKHQILICHDNPYAFILNNQPESLLSIEGAKEVVIELNSLSKSQNMAGWRVGMLIAAEDRINEILRFKSNMDSGMFLPVQLAAAKALSLDEGWYESVNKIYTARREKVFELLDVLKCAYSKQQVGMFVWAKIPATFKDGYALSDKVLYEANVFITPGGWSQVCAKINKNGKNLSIDILDMDKVDNIFFYKKDFNDHDFFEFINEFFDHNKVDIVLSDMAVNTTGNKDLDAIKTNSTALDVVNLSKLILKPKSSLLVKIFSGMDENMLIKNAKNLFKNIDRIKPDSSRKESREMYLLCRDLKII